MNMYNLQSTRDLQGSKNKRQADSARRCRPVKRMPHHWPMASALFQQLVQPLCYWVWITVGLPVSHWDSGKLATEGQVALQLSLTATARSKQQARRGNGDATWGEGQGWRGRGKRGGWACGEGRKDASASAGAYQELRMHSGDIPYLVGEDKLSDTCCSREESESSTIRGPWLVAPLLLYC
jgi:hypothetical protein